MAGDARDLEFHSRVHEGHLKNFVRKVCSADSPRALNQLHLSITTAIRMGMLHPEDREILAEYMQRRHLELEREAQEDRMF